MYFSKINSHNVFSPRVYNAKWRFTCNTINIKSCIRIFFLRVTSTYHMARFSFQQCACLNWQRAHVLNMPIKPFPLYRSGTCMLVTSSGTHTTSLLLRELISLSIIPQMFALMSSCVVLHHSPQKSKHGQVETVHIKSEYSKTQSLWLKNLHLTH